MDPTQAPTQGADSSSTQQPARSSAKATITSCCIIPSTLAPHHGVNIIFDPTIVREGEMLVPLQPSQVEDRYQPLPLVPDASVQSNFPWLNDAETQRFVLFATTSTFPAQEFTATGDLADDMERVIVHAGYTNLYVMTYLTPEDANIPNYSFVRVRIARETRFWRRGGRDLAVPRHEYESINRTWIQLEPEFTWQWEVKPVLGQVYDRDVRHVQHQLEANGMAYGTNRRWKPPRSIPASQCIEHMAEVMSKAALDQHNQTLPIDDKVLNCPSCMEPFGDDPSNRAVILPCSERRYICTVCLEHWCEQSGVCKATCPHCRKQIAKPDFAQIVQPNHLDLDVTFVDDPRYSDYENFERGLAAVDRIDVRKNNTSILIDKDVWMQAWNIVVPYSFDDDNTPCHLTTVLAPEAWFFFKSFCETIQQLHGKRLLVSQFYDILSKNVHQALKAEYIANGMAEFLNATVLIFLNKLPSALSLRPGFTHFIHKSLSRVVLLPVVRACYEHREHITPDNPMGWHKHGDVRFHCPADGAIVSAN